MQQVNVQPKILNKKYEVDLYTRSTCTLYKIYIKLTQYHILPGPYNSWADVVRLLAERYNTKSNVKLGRFRSQLQASYVSSHTEKLWYNETVCLWMTIYIYIYIQESAEKFRSWQRLYYAINQAIGLMSRVFTNGPGDRGSIPGRVIPKTQKMVLDAALLNKQHNMVRIKGKVEQS